MKELTLLGIGLLVVHIGILDIIAFLYSLCVDQTLLVCVQVKLMAAEKF